LSDKTDGCHVHNNVVISHDVLIRMVHRENA